MKKPFGIKLDPQLAQRLDILAAASRIKRNTLIEMAVEKHLPELEKRYGEEIQDYIASLGPDLRKQFERPGKYPAHKPTGYHLNEPKEKLTKGEQAAIDTVNAIGAHVKQGEPPLPPPPPKKKRKAASGGDSTKP